MTLQEFCAEYGWPPAKVSRLIRAAVFTDIFGRADPDAETIRNQPIEWKPRSGGFRVTKPAGRTNLQYNIFEPDKLETWLANEADRPPLNDEEIDLLLSVAKSFYDTQREDGPYRLVKGHSSLGKYIQIDEDLVTQLQGILRRAGRI